MTDLPRPPRSLVVVTQSLLGLMFLIGLSSIALLPSLAAGTAECYPEYAALRTPLLGLAIAIVALGLLALAMIALLVHRVRKGSILDHSTSLLWVDVLVSTLVCGAVLVVTSFVVVDNAQAGTPALAFVQVAACVGLFALACILLVLRSLLRDAISMRAELDVVV